MNNLNPFEVNFNGVITRFYLMIAAAIICGFLGHFILAAILAYGFGLSAILGLTWKTEKARVKQIKQEKPIKKSNTPLAKAA